MRKIIILLIIFQFINLGYQQLNYNWFYLEESDFYFGYQLDTYSLSAKANFQIKGQYDGWVGIGIQDSNGNEDIAILYKDSTSSDTSGCTLKDYYRAAGTNKFVQDTVDLVTPPNIDYCQDSTNLFANQVSFEKPQYNSNDLNQDIKIVGDTLNEVYRITLYKGYKIDGSSDDAKSILLAPKYQQTYYIPFTTDLNPCMHTCSSKTKLCETQDDYIQYNVVDPDPLLNNVDFQYNSGSEYFCFTKQPPIWNKLYNSVDDFEIFYGIKYIFHQEYDPSQIISSQKTGFIYFRLVGQSINSATYGGFLAVTINDSSTTDMFIVTKVNGEMEIKDYFLTHGTTTSTQDTDLSIKLVTGEKDDDTNIYDVTVVRPLKIINNPSQDLEIIPVKSSEQIDATSNIYTLNLYFGTTDIYSSGKLDNANKNTWDQVIFFEEQFCGFQCESASTSPYCKDLCFTTNQPCYDCPSDYCLGPDPEQCYSCHDNCKTCFGPYSNNCKSCIDTDNRILYLNECVVNRPVYWNKLIDKSNLDLTIYYGFDTSYSQIHFKIKGQHKNDIIKITLSDGTNSDIYNILGDFLVNPNPEFIYVTGFLGTSPDEYEVYYLRSRKAIGGVSVEIDFETQFTLQVDIINAGATFETFTESNFVFNQMQQCEGDCNQCAGPEEELCLNCNIDYGLDDTIPGTCGDITLQTTCAYLHTRYKNDCIMKYPQFWNKLELGDTNFDLYYGFEMSYDKTSVNPPELMYFRLVGYNRGWVALAFGSNHDKVDMVVITMNNDQIQVQDRISGTHKDYKMAIREIVDDQLYITLKDSGINQKPEFDTGVSNYMFIEGNRSSNYVWDVTFVRSVYTADSEDKDLTNIIKYTKIDPTYQGQRVPVTLALGDGDNFVKHSSYQRNYILFDTLQQCDSSCLQCSGPESYQCIQCDSDLYGLKDNTAPNYCVELEYFCHILCKTCYGNKYNQCLTCADSDQMAIQGNCISKEPAFWNKFQVNTNFNLYYGYTQDKKQIFYRLQGTPNLTYKGWIGIGFGNSMDDTDMVIVRKQAIWNEITQTIVNYVVLVEDRYSKDIYSPPKLDYEYNSSQDYYYVTGDRDEVTFEWDVTIMRYTDNKDQYDQYIDPTKRSLTVAWGIDDKITKHGGFQILNDVRLRTYQVCSNLCLDCIGPEDNECNVCIVGYELAGTAPNICQAEVLICHSDCDTGMCTGDSSSECTACASFDNFVLQGSCVLKNPIFWNKINVNENLDFYYGFNQEDTIFYSRFKGTASGWVAIGYNSEMRNTDMIILRKDPADLSQILLEDRYSLGHTVPLLDMRQDSSIISSSWIGDDLDVIYARYKNTKDTVRDSIITHNKQNLIFAIGTGHDFAVAGDTHKSFYMLEDQYFFNSQQCPQNCSSCTGPEDSECLNWEKLEEIFSVKLVFNWIYLLQFIGLIWAVME